jgi:DNA-binding winged helix-turn-helix (wHTH) protein
MDVHAVETTRLPLTYRRAEVSAITRCLNAGDSCSIIGVSGMAKSNLFRYLLDADVRRHYLGEGWQSYLFVALDANEVGEMSESAVCSLLLERLLDESRRRGAAKDVVSRLERLQQNTLASDALPLQRVLAQAVESVIAPSDDRLVFLFDQFDGIYKGLPPHFFANLRSIRDGYKYRISYVVFTRDDLSRLCRSQENEEFEELFSANVIGLGPYDRDDALLLLNRVGTRYGRTLPSQTCERLIALTGGHPGLLKAACMAMIKTEMELPDEQRLAVEALLAVRDVQSECIKLWNSISHTEQDFLRRLAVSKIVLHQDAEAERLLQMKGLVLEEEGESVTFSPIFSRYVSVWRAVEPPSTKIQAGPIRIDTAGEVWMDEKQVTPPLSKKELLLLEYLCLEPGRLRTKDEIIAVVYPDEYKSGESISDDAINTLVKRLRDHLERFGKHGGIVTVRGKGYRLDTIRTVKV